MIDHPWKHERADFLDRLDATLNVLQDMAQNDMGLLDCNTANRFHQAVTMLEMVRNRCPKESWGLDDC